MLHLIDTISTYLDQREIPIAFFLDLSKAFDTLDHSILLQKLYLYGVDNISLKLFENYLTNRKQFVYHHGFISDLSLITTGVSQGSIWGPLIFLLYINDFHCAFDIFQLIMYADDTTLIAKLSDFKENSF